MLYSTGGSNRSPHAVANHENLDAIMSTADNTQKGHKVANKVAEPPNIASPTLRPAMSSLVKTIDGIALGHKVVNQVHIAPAMLS
jgi:uncharacterized protein YaaN involved in tellurite resistance